MSLNCTFTVSPNLIVSNLLPEKFWERDDCNELFEEEIQKCREMGVEAYVHTYNSEIEEAKTLKKKYFFRGYEKTSLKSFMAYFTRLENMRTPIIQLKLAS